MHPPKPQRPLPKAKIEEREEENVFVELHILQNFAPANLNRDDTGAPKDCEFGGYRRARISSQCLKRATRRDGGFAELLEQRGGVRTRHLLVEIAERVANAKPAPERTLKVISEVFAQGGIDLAKEHGKETDHTKLILFLDKAALDEITALFRGRWEALAGGSKQDRAVAVRDLGAILAGAVKAPDIALFGRMVEIDADKPFGKLGLGIDAACQVAHAISTNAVSVEFDFYTAVDELLPKGDQGAAMMGTVEFNSACFYRYANVDLEQLSQNLGHDTDLARASLSAFLGATIAAVPTGKQNSMAAQNPPSFILAVVRQKGLWSLANAFVRPVYPDQTGDLVQNSVKALDAYWGKLAALYGEQGIAGKWCASLDGHGLHHLEAARVKSVTELLDNVMASVAFVGEGK